MTKRQFIDLIIHRLSGGDCPQELKGKYHPQIVSKHITIGLNYLINQFAYQKARKEGNWSILDSYTKTFKNVEVLNDSDRDEKYSNLPVSVISLPGNRGVRMISPMKDQSFAFLYRYNNSVNIYSKLDVNEVSQIPRYYIEASKKVFYSEHLHPNIDNVLMKLIPEFDSLEDDDEANFPEDYGKFVIDLVFQSMMGMPLEKVSNDNNANTI